MSAAAEGPGAALKDARVALDVTTREVADALNLPVSVVEAMEANDYERLPQPVFTRGYLRSYARLLELDPAAIVARYPVAADETFETGEQELIAPEQTRSLPVEKKVIAALGGLILALLLVLWLLPGDETPEESPRVATEPEAVEPAATDPAGTEAAAVEPEAPADPAASGVVRPVTATPVPEAAPDPAGDVLDRPPAQPPRSPEEPRAAAAQAVGAAEPAGVPESAESAEVPEPAEVAAPATATDAAPAQVVDAAASAVLEAPTPAGFRRITPFGEDELVLTFAEDCWVQVRNLDGANLYGDLNRAGGTLRLIGRAPFRVRLGYAPGATLELNGDAVELTRYTRNNVANVVVGR